MTDLFITRSKPYNSTNAQHCFPRIQQTWPARFSPVTHGLQGSRMQANNDTTDCYDSYNKHKVLLFNLT